MPTSSKRNANRLHAGKMPKGGVHIANIVCGAEVWHLATRFDATSGTGSWVGLKLFAKEPVPTKANYWFSWSSPAARLAAHPDVALLREGRPELHAALVRALTAIRGEYGDPRAIGDDAPLVFKADPLTPIGVEGVKVLAPASPPTTDPLTPLYLEGSGSRGGEHDDSNSSGDPDEDIL